MVKRVIISFSDEELEKIDTLSASVNLSRNKLIQQICRQYFGMPSVLKEAEVIE